MSKAARPSPIDYLMVGLISAATLAYEILLLRVFSFSQWHHFASLAVSLALLGFGAAGTLLVLLGKRARQHYDKLFLAAQITGAAGMLATSLLPHAIRVRPLFAIWHPGELLKLLLLDFAAFIPFFGMALCIGLVFVRWPEATRRLYGANLLGSGAGAIAASLLLGSVFLESALLLMPAVVLLTAALFCIGKRLARRTSMACLAGCLLLGVWIWIGPPRLPVSDFKRLAYLRDLPFSQLVERRPGLQAEVSVIRAGSIRMAAGLSLRWPDPIPPTDALVLGSDTVIPLPVSLPDGYRPPHYQALLGALPFLLRPDGAVAVVGTSEWLAVDPVRIRPLVWIERNPEVVSLFRERGLLQEVDVRSVDPRGFFSARFPKFSLIYLAQCFSEGDSASEDYLLTLESINAALGKLDQDGLLAIPLRLGYPPRYAPKLLATVAQALRDAGLPEPDRHVAFLRSMQEGLLLVGRSALQSPDISAIREFSAKWEFDLAALPGLAAAEANRFHFLPDPAYYLTAEALLGSRGPVPPSAAWYTLDVPTDDRPYFWRSMRWRNAPGLVSAFGRAGLIWLDWALLITAAKLALAGSLAVALILLPLGNLPRPRKPLTRFRVMLYFSALGLGFMLLEMAAFQRCILFLVDPVLTASVVFAVFLVGAGFGSLTAPEGKDRHGPFAIFLSILSAALLAFGLLQLGRDTLCGMPAWIRIAAVAAILSPLAWSLGAAFPWGLRQLDEDRPLIPWAWGINGFASVIAAPAATLLSVHLGQPVTWLAGAACYGCAWLVARTWTRQWGWY